MAAPMSSRSLLKTGTVNRIGFLMSHSAAKMMRVARGLMLLPQPHETQFIQPKRWLTLCVKRLLSEQEGIAMDETKIDDIPALNEVGLEMKPRGYMAARPVDDVYMLAHYPPQKISFDEAMEKLRYQDRWAHCRKPELYRDRTVTIGINLDMALDKKKKVVAFQNMVILPHQWKQDNKVLCFVEEPDVAMALDAGAHMVGNTDTVQDILDHRIHHRSFDYCVATPEMMPSLTKLKEKLRKRFPASKRGSVSSNIPAMLNLYKKGQEYKVNTKQNTINCPIGKLSLTNEQLEENMAAIISDVCSHKPLEYGPFIKSLAVTAFLLDGHMIEFMKYLPVPDDETKLKEELERLQDEK